MVRLSIQQRSGRPRPVDRPVRITLKTGSRLRGSTMTGYKVEQDWKVVSVEPPDNDTHPEGGP